MRLAITNSRKPKGILARHIRRLLLLTALAIGASEGLQAQLVYGLSGNNLVSFDAANPGMVMSMTSISGIADDQELSGMDFRPNTGELYAIGYNQTTGEARLYVINTSTGAATAVGMSAATLAANMGQITFDFNPTVDRIRVMGSSGVNYRMHPVTGAVVATDGVLAYAAGDINAAVTPSIATSAYTNSYIGTTTTTLYNFDALLGIITTQIPPNNGTLNTVGATGLIVDPINPLVDMDIFFDAAAQTNRAFIAAAAVGAQASMFYTLDLSSGAAAGVGLIGQGIAVNDIAIFIDRTVPAEVTGQLVYAVTANNSLISFDSDAPGIVRSIVSVIGIAMGQVLAGVDFRPNTGELYGIGYNAATGEARLYVINTATGAATAIGMSAATLAANMGQITFDFNPTVDRIRVMGSSGVNYRMHPVTGAVVATDGVLAYAAGDINAAVTPSIATSAYTNSYIGTTTTTLYNFDALLGIITTQIPPNNGTLNTVGATGLIVDPINPLVDMDIFFDAAAQTNRAFIAAAAVGAQASMFYTLDLSSGAAAGVGLIGQGIAVNDIAIFIDRTVPDEVTGQLVYAVTGNNSLITFDSELPEVVRSITTLTGLFAAQTVQGLDFRPATGQLYTIGYNNTSGMARLYVVEPATGATMVIGADSVMLQPGMAPITFDFNPTVDRIRVMGANGANYRMHPETGVVVAADGMLAYAAGDANEGQMARVGAGAYTNSFAGTTSTVLYDYDYILNVLASQIPPNNGTLNTIGESGIVVNADMPSIDMDIFYDYATGGNAAFMNANTGTGVNDRFYRLDLTTGAATLVGSIGLGIPVRNIALGLDTPPAQPSTVFVAQLSGRNEPFPVASTGSGEVAATLTGNELKVSGTFDNLSSPVDVNIAGGAHLHVGFAGQNGPVTLPLVFVPDADLLGGSFPEAANTFMLSSEQVAQLEGRQLYVNLHTTSYPMGELRGQLLPESDEYYTANLFGSNEAPSIISNGHGALALELHGDTLIVSGSFAELDGNFDPNIAGGAHLHLGLAGATGGVSILLNTTADADLGGGVFMPDANSFVLNTEQLEALRSRQLYANIHSTLHSSGELRGQVLGAADAAFRAHLSGSNEYPFVTSLAGGQVIAEISDSTLIVTGRFNGLESNFNANVAGGAHIHMGVAGRNGGIALELTTTVDADGRGGAFMAADNTFAITPEQRAMFFDRGLYVNIHTSALPGGEIRGQLLYESQIVLNALLTGSQEPLPHVSSDAHGAAMAEISGNSLVITGSFAELQSAFNPAIAGGAHLHLGLPGVSGPVAIVLNTNIDSDARGGVFQAGQNRFAVNANQRAALLNRGVYVNVHSVEIPSGEVRGNLMAEAATYFFSPLSGVSEATPFNTGATGMVILEVSRNQATAVGSFDDLRGNFDPNIAGGAHIHMGYAGSNGGIVQHLEATLNSDQRGGAFLAADNTFAISSGLLDTLRERMLYVNIHTMANASGEVRGQLLPAAASYFHSSLSGINEFPALLTSGFGGLKLELNGNMLTATGSFANLQGNFDANIAGGAHIHIGEPGSNGGILVGLEPTLSANLRSGIFAASDNTFMLTPEQVMSVRGGEWYANIHTMFSASGEVRGQILPEINFFPEDATILLPLPGSSVLIEGLPTEEFVVNWLPGAEPDGDNVAYTWQVAIDAAFSTIVYMQSTGEEPGLTLPFSAIEALLADNGVMVGATVEVYHRVVVTDGSNFTAESPALVNITRGTLANDNSTFATNFSLRAFPTVTTGIPVMVQITASESLDADLLILDPLGRVLERRPISIQYENEAFNIDLSGYAAGVYYVTLATTSGDMLPVQRVVKQ